MCLGPTNFFPTNLTNFLFSSPSPLLRIFFFCNLLIVFHSPRNFKKDLKNKGREDITARDRSMLPRVQPPNNFIHNRLPSFLFSWISSNRYAKVDKMTIWLSHNSSMQQKSPRFLHQPPMLLKIFNGSHFETWNEFKTSQHALYGKHVGKGSFPKEKSSICRLKEIDFNLLFNLQEA